MCVQFCCNLFHDDINTLQCFLNVPYGKEVINGWKMYLPLAIKGT